MSTDRPKHGDVSAAFARARRQRDADNAGRPDRIADLGRGLASLIPPMHPLGFTRELPSIFGEGIIPPRFPVPAKVAGFPLEIFDDAIAHAEIAPLVKLVDEKLRLEDERVRRLLPALPAGYSWRGEIETREHVDFASLEDSVTMRIVYRLHGPDGERLDMSAREAWAHASEG